MCRKSSDARQRSKLSCRYSGDTFRHDPDAVITNDRTHRSRELLKAVSGFRRKNVVESKRPHDFRITTSDLLAAFMLSNESRDVQVGLVENLRCIELV